MSAEAAGARSKEQGASSGSGSGSDTGTRTPDPGSRISWIIQGQLAGWLDRDGWRFAGTTSLVGGEWQTLGLCTPIPGVKLDVIQGVLDEHHHQVLGSPSSLEEARQLVERFLLESPVPEERCGCPDLGGQPADIRQQTAPDPDPKPAAKLRNQQRSCGTSSEAAEPGASEPRNPIRSADSPDVPLERSIAGTTIRFDTATVTLEGILPPGFSGPVAAQVQDIFRPVQLVLEPGRYSMLLDGSRLEAPSDADWAMPIEDPFSIGVGCFVAVWLENRNADIAAFRVRLRGHSGERYRGPKPAVREEIGCAAKVGLGLEPSTAEGNKFLAELEERLSK